MPDLTHRLAVEADIPALTDVMEAAISGPLAAFLSPEQVEASRAIMGVDTQLISDRTYFVVEEERRIAGCGGWSRRATLYGGDHTPSREPALLTPGQAPARVRAMYTHPAFVRRGVGRPILQLCEAAARAEGFHAVQMAATLGGEPLYRAAGYAEIERVEDDRGGVAVPLIRMGKSLELQA
jgi:GNAT superfamily N-acetyltransferase